MTTFTRQNVSPSLRARVFERDGFRCRRCGRHRDDVKTLHCDHIIPVARGGKSVEWNLQTLCDACNLGKSDRAPTDHDARRAETVVPIATVQEPGADHPLVGKYCHQMHSSGVWRFQARVVSVVGETGMLQFYSAFDGQPTTIQPRPLAELLDGTWVFYETAEAWRTAGDRMLRSIL